MRPRKSSAAWGTSGRAAVSVGGGQSADYHALVFCRYTLFVYRVKKKLYLLGARIQETGGMNEHEIR